MPKRTRRGTSGDVPRDATAVGTVPADVGAAAVVGWALAAARADDAPAALDRLEAAVRAALAGRGALPDFRAGVLDALGRGGQPPERCLAAVAYLDAHLASRGLALRPRPQPGAAAVHPSLEPVGWSWRGEAWVKVPPGPTDRLWMFDVADEGLAPLLLPGEHALLVTFKPKAPPTGGDPAVGLHPRGWLAGRAEEIASSCAAPLALVEGSCFSSMDRMARWPVDTLGWTLRPVDADDGQPAAT